MRDKVSLLAVEGVGPARYRKLVNAFGSPGAVFAASKTELEALVGEALALAIKSFDPARVARDISFIEESGVRALGFWEDEYPDQLRGLDGSPPVLFVLGSTDALWPPGIAVVGTRRPTPYGRRVAEELGDRMGRAGVVLVSGGALGVDGIAHRAALAAGGKTVAVLGSGHAFPSPSSHIELFARIADAGGAVVSEFLPTVQPEPGHFPRRNRVISALARAVVVVEGNVDSGALITARWALDQSRDVYAVPGSIYSPKSRGTNWLIAQGAYVYTGPRAVLGEIRNEPLPEMNDEEQRLFGLLGSEPLHVDELADALKTDVPKALSVLLSLEMKGAVRQLPGKFFVRAK